MASPDPIRQAVGRVNFYRRPDRYDPAKLAEARRDLAAAKVERAIHEAVDGAHPLSIEQREHLAALLLGTDLNARVADLLGDDA